MNSGWKSSWLCLFLIQQKRIVEPAFMSLVFIPRWMLTICAFLLFVPILNLFWSVENKSKQKFNIQHSNSVMTKLVDEMPRTKLGGKLELAFAYKRLKVLPDPISSELDTNRRIVWCLVHTSSGQLLIRTSTYNLRSWFMLNSD